jgi:hypothetical protein
MEDEKQSPLTQRVQNYRDGHETVKAAPCPQERPQILPNREWLVSFSSDYG